MGIAELLSTNSDLNGISHLLVNGQFRFRSMQEAKLLAQLFSNACPNPRLAVVGISELLINAIEHGNLGITSEEKSDFQKKNRWLEEIERRLDLPENKNKYAETEFIRTATEIQLTVTDQGKGFPWQQYESNSAKDLKSSHGRGILMAKQLTFKKLQYIGNGNKVIATISLKPLEN